MRSREWTRARVQFTDSHSTVHGERAQNILLENARGILLFIRFNMTSIPLHIVSMYSYLPFARFVSQENEIFVFKVQKKDKIEMPTEN